MQQWLRRAVFSVIGADVLFLLESSNFLDKNLIALRNYDGTFRDSSHEVLFQEVCELMDRFDSSNADGHNDAEIFNITDLLWKNRPLIDEEREIREAYPEAA